MDFEKLMKDMEDKGLINQSSWKNMFKVTSTNKADEVCNQTWSPKLLFIKKPSPLKLEGNLSESWKKFKRDFENYLFMSEEDDKDDAIKINILKDYIGESGLNLINSFDFHKTDQQKYDVIISKLEEYCCGSKNIVMRRFKFLKTRQEEGESFDEFLTTLVSRISECKYGSQEASILRDLIIVGLKDTVMREQLLRQTNISLHKTVKFVADKEQMRKNLTFFEASALKPLNIIERFPENDENQNIVSSTTNKVGNGKANLENKGPTLDASFIKQPSPLQLSGNLPMNWKKFKRDFENYLIMIEKDEAKDRIKIAFLETYIGESGLELIDSFRLSRVDKGKYDVTLSKLEEFCNRSKNIVMERFEFLRIIQEEDESFDDFFTKLKLKISECDYGDEEDSILRDVIICGLRDTDIQESLLGQTNITLKETVKYVKAAEDSLRSYLEKVFEKKKTRLSTSDQKSSRTSRATSPQMSEVSSPQINQVSSQKSSRASSPQISQVSSACSSQAGPSVSSNGGQLLIQKRSEVTTSGNSNKLASHPSTIRDSIPQISQTSSLNSTISEKAYTPPSSLKSENSPVLKQNVERTVMPKESSKPFQNLKVIDETVVQNGASVSFDKGQLVIQKQSEVATSGNSYKFSFHPPTIQDSIPQTSQTSCLKSPISKKPCTPPSSVGSVNDPTLKQNVESTVMVKESSKPYQNLKVMDETLVRNGASVNSHIGQLLIQKQSVVAASGGRNELAEICNSLTQCQPPSSEVHNTFNIHNTYNTYNTTSKNEYTSPSSSCSSAITSRQLFGGLCSYPRYEDLIRDQPCRSSVVRKSDSWNSREPVTDLRGIGKVYGGRLEAMGYRSVDDLQRKFSSVGRDGFNRWLRSEVGVRSDYAAGCTEDVASRY